MTIRDQIFNFVKKKYKASPEYLWWRYLDYAIFRMRTIRSGLAL